MSPEIRGIAVLVLVVLLVGLPICARGDDSERSRLHALLQSDAAVHDKAVACKRLAVIGTKESVPVLASLLGDEKLSHYARFGLEAIPDPSVDQALRDALGTLHGPQLVGVINSLGIRRDAAAVVPLQDLLAHADPQTASAAAGALGRIADERAVRTLLRFLEDGSHPHRTSIADACLTAAGLLLAAGDLETALSLYQAVRQADVPKHIRIAATLATVRTQDAASIRLLADLLRSEDDEFFALALQASRDVRGDAVARALTGELGGQPPARKALLLTALADRGDKTALPVLLDAARSGEPLVQAAGIDGLARVGDSSVVDVLMELATHEDNNVAAASRRALERLPGADVDEAILAPSNEEDAGRFALLIHLAGSRRIASAVPTLLKAADSDSQSLRVAAISALGETIASDQLDVLVRKVLSPNSPDEEAAAKAALTSAGVRMADRDACAQQVQSLFSAGPAEKQAALFELLRELGGDAALKIVVAGARDRSDVIQDAATRALGEWLTEDVAPELLALAQSPDARKYQVRAVRGYIRVIRQFGLPVDQRAEMARSALRVAERDEEKQLVLEALSRFPSPQALAIAVEQLSNPSLKEVAAQAIVAISQQLTSDADREAVRNALQKVMDVPISAEITRRASALLERAGR